MIKKLLPAFLIFVALHNAYGQSGLCNTNYWNHTYANERLKIYDSCYTITGTVQLYIPPFLNGDGDYHIYIQPDSEYSWMLHYRDTAFTKFCAGVDSSGYMVCPTCLNVEEVCKGTILDGGTAGIIENAACLGFSDTVYLPNIGEYVSATGPFVYDTVHCWNELHPISKMVLLHPTGVPEPVESTIANGLKVFPQPADNQVSFQFDRAPEAITLIKLYDIVGRQLYVYALAKTSLLNVDISSWPAGEYLYSVVLQEQRKALKRGRFIVAH